MGNGINATRAHLARTANDNTYVDGRIGQLTILAFGAVVSYINERVTVQAGNDLFTNVEVMVLGVNGWGIKPVPAVGDRVLLVATQKPVADIATFAANGSMPAYDRAGLKAICVTDSTRATQLITVSNSGISITGSNKLTINSNGIAVTDTNNNKITTNSNGVAIVDKNNNKITTDGSGVTIEDKNSNKIVMGSSNVTINGKLSIGR